MPAEAHQLGPSVQAHDVVDLLCLLLADQPFDDPAGATLSALGVDDEGLSALWDAVCEEFAERTLGPDLEAGVLDVSMTLADAAVAMAALLTSSSGDDD